MDNQYEDETGLGKYGEGIYSPIEKKSQDTNFGLSSKPTWKDIKAMMAKKRERNGMRKQLKPQLFSC